MERIGEVEAGYVASILKSKSSRVRVIGVGFPWGPTASVAGGVGYTKDDRKVCFGGPKGATRIGEGADRRGARNRRGGAIHVPMLGGPWRVLYLSLPGDHGRVDDEWRRQREEAINGALEDF